MSGYLPIKNQLVAILQGMSSLKVVYGKEEKVFSGYPAACVSAKEHTSEFETVGGIGGKNKRVYQHFIRVYFRTDENNDPDYEDVLESIADDVISALEHNITLNGSCDWSLPISGTWLFGQKESPERVFEIVMVATVFATR